MALKPRQKYMDKLFLKAKEAHLSIDATGSQIARHNSRFLRSLEEALAANPELDLATMLDAEKYAEERAKSKAFEVDLQRGQLEKAALAALEAKLREEWGDLIDPSSLSRQLLYLKTARKVTVKSTLSSEVNCILRKDPGSEVSPTDLYDALSKGHLLFQCEGDQRRMIIKLNDSVVVKIVSARDDDGREHAALKYLRDHLPDLPVPLPLGQLQIKKRSMIFMSFVPGKELEEVWPLLNDEQKRSIGSQLDHFFQTLRALKQSPGQLWGGCGGQGCLDQRRLTRYAEKPVHNAEEFEEFFFSRSRFGDGVWADLLRQSYKLPSSDGSDDECVLTHGDLRLANIMVIPTDGGD